MPVGFRWPRVTLGAGRAGEGEARRIACRQTLATAQHLSLKGRRTWCIGPDGPRRVGAWEEGRRRVQAPRCFGVQAGEDEASAPMGPELPYDLTSDVSFDKQEVSDILAGQLKRRRAAESKVEMLQKETNRLEALVDSLTEENKELAEEPEELRAEIAEKNMKLEELVSQLDDLRGQYEVSVSMREEAEEEYSRLYLKSRTEAEKNVEMMYRKQWLRDERALQVKLNQAAALLAEKEAELSALKVQSNMERVSLVDENTASLSKEYSLECEKARASTEAASKAASESASAVIHVMQEQSRVRQAAADIRSQALSAERVVHQMKEQIQTLNEECSKLKDALKRKAEELAESTRARVDIEKKASQRVSEIEQRAQDNIKSVQEAFDQMKVGMDERVAFAEETSEDSRRQLDELLSEVNGLREELAKQTSLASQNEAKLHAMEQGVSEQRRLLEEEVEVRVARYTDKEKTIQKAAAAEASQKAFQQQEEILKMEEERQGARVQRLKQGEQGVRMALQSTLAERKYWEQRARSAELMLRHLEEEEKEEEGDVSDKGQLSLPNTGGGGRLRLNCLSGPMLRDYLVNGARSDHTGGETSQTINSDWKAEAADGTVSFRPE